MDEPVVVEQEEPADVLACVRAVQAIEAFTPDGVDKILAVVRKVSCNEVADLSTGVSRARISARTGGVKAARAYLNKARLALVAGWKAKSTAVDVEGKKLQDGLAEIRDEVRRPLTEWEDAEEAKAEAIRLEEEAEAQRKADEAEADRLELEALKAKVAAQEEAEARRLEAEAAAKVKAERDRLNAIEKKKEAERQKAAAVLQAKADAKAEIQKAKEAQDAAEEAARLAEGQAKYREKQAEEREERRIEQAEKDRKAAEEAETERTRLAAEQAKKDTAAAVQAERNRIEQERKDEAAKKVKAAADEERQLKCYSDAFGALVKMGIPSDFAGPVLDAVASGKVPWVQFNYTEDVQGGVEQEEDGK